MPWLPWFSFKFIILIRGKCRGTCRGIRGLYIEASLVCELEKTFCQP